MIDAQTVLEWELSWDTREEKEIQSKISIFEQYLLW